MYIPQVAPAAIQVMTLRIVQMNWLEVDWCLSGLSDHNLLRNLAGRGFAAGRNQGDQKPLKRLGSVWLVFSPR